MTKPELLTAIHAATGPSREIDAHLALQSGWTLQKMKNDAKPYWREPGVTEYFLRKELPKYTESLDAAVALCERMLPGWDYGAERDSGTFNSWVSDGDAYLAADEYATPALALCAAVIAALIAQEEQND